MKLNHIGIITNNIDEDVLLYQRMGYQIVSQIVDEIQMNKVIIVRRDDFPDIELIEAVNDKSTIRNFKKGYHHLCFESEADEDIVAIFKQMKVGRIFTPPISAPALGHRSVVFACLHNGCFIELILNKKTI